MPGRPSLRAKQAKPTVSPADPSNRTLDARPDTLDFRDLLYKPALIEVPTTVSLKDYRSYNVPVLDQGTEGACTGFGLATVANYLLRRRKVIPDANDVSPYMFYALAKRYDEWPGEDYEGSSARGAMKGWHKHGVCSMKHWSPESERDPQLYSDRWADAIRRPLGAYFRVNHKDLIAMHAALAEVGILYATSGVHAGWQAAAMDGTIPYPNDLLGGHAFAIVGYEERGFWIQNSWGAGWGKDGFGLISYDDWLANGTDVWVGRLGAPVILAAAGTTATGISPASKGSRGYVFCDLRPHIISVGEDGRLETSGTYGTSEADVQEILAVEFPRITQNWKRKRLLLYAHGGLVGEDAAIQRVADYRGPLLEQEVYPLAFLWHTDYWTTITNVLEDVFRRRRPEGIVDSSKDFMLSRLDDALEPLARMLTGKASWDAIKRKAILATESKDGAAKFVADQIAALKTIDEIHVAGHSAGAVFHAPLVAYLTKGLKKTVTSCTLWAPACTLQLFDKYYVPSIDGEAGGIERFAIFTLTDPAERADNCARIYHKSLLYLVSDALEAHQRLPLFGKSEGEPLLGMEKFLAERLADKARRLRVDWVTSPNDKPLGDREASRSASHGGFDDDQATLQATLARILGINTFPATSAQFMIHRSASSQLDIRTQLPDARSARS